jgi:DNA-binding NarL/FixJ family response regulator
MNLETRNPGVLRDALLVPRQCPSSNKIPQKRLVSNSRLWVICALVSDSLLPLGARNRCRILLADAMEVFRIGVAQGVASMCQMMVCATTGDLDDVPDLIERHRPRLLIAEPFRSDSDGLVWIKECHGRFPETKILVTSSQPEITYAERALRAGASVYWMKNGSVESLRDAIQTVIAGEIWVSRHIATLAVHKLAHGVNGNGDRLTELSDRELTVFASIAARHGTGQIARELGISRKTVEAHCAHIKLKLGYRNAADLKRGAIDSLAQS